MSINNNDDDFNILDDWFIKATLVICIIGLGVFIFWAGFIPLAQGIIAQGKVAVYSERKSVQHLEGGIISEIKVFENQVVAKGDVLIVLDDMKSSSQLISLQNEYYHILATINRLTAEANLQSSITFDQDLLGHEHSEIKLIMQSQASLFQANSTKVNGEIQVLLEQKQQAEDELKGFLSQQASLKDRFIIAKNELQHKRDLRQKKLVTVQEVLTAEKEFIDLTGSVGDIAANIARTHNKLDEFESQITNRRKIFKEQALEELPILKEKIAKIQENINLLSDVVVRNVIRAPQAGKIVELQFHTIGGVVRPGDTILDIVPLTDKYVIKSQVKLIDVDSIYVGKKTRVVFIGLNVRTLDNIYGEVIGISGDAIEDEKKRDVFYEVVVDVPPEELQKIGDVQIVSGMPVETVFEGNSRTLLEYLGDPIVEVLEKALIEE